MAEQIPSPVRFLIGITRAILDEVAELVRDPVVFNALRAELGLPPRQLDEDAIQEVNAKLTEADGRLSAAEEAPDNDLSLDESILDFLALGSKVAEILQVIVGDGGTAEQVAELTYACLGIIVSERLRLRAPLFWAIIRLVMLGYEKAEDVPRFNPIEIFERLAGNKEPVYADPFGSFDVISGLAVPPLVIGLSWLVGKAESEPYEIAQLPNGSWYFDGDVGFKLGWEPDPNTPDELQVLLARALTLRATAELKVKGESSAVPVTLLFTIMPVGKDDGGPGFIMRLAGDFGFARDLAPGALIKRKIELKVVGAGGVDYFWDTENGKVKRLPGAEETSIATAAWSALGTEDVPAFRLGQAGKSRIDVAGVEIKGELSNATTSIGLGVKGGKLVLLAKDIVPEIDFLFEAIGAERFEAKIDGSLKLDGEAGLTFEGEAGLKTRLFSHVDIKVGRIDYVDLLVGVKDRKLVLGAEVAAKFEIGPFTASIDRFGITTPADGGTPSFHPPKGIGIRLDFAVVKGGGFLLLDYEKKRFAGAFQLAIAGISVNAIVILSAGGPNTDADFALFALIYARFPGGLELGLRFTLNAIGGIIGINHGFDNLALERALPSGAMDDVLFPADPVGDAPRIIASLSTIFPVRKNAWTFGFMLEVGWGSDYFCSLRLGVIVPVGAEAHPGDSFRYIYLIGRMSVVCFEHIPKPIRLQLICDFIGEIGFYVQQKPFKMQFSIKFYARLRDSRLGPTAIEGAIVFSMKTGPDARLLLAAGGFHPGFKQVPADVASPIDRIGTSYDIGVFKAWLRAYFAVASGTLQFGFAIGCQYKLGPIAFRGELAADVLIHLSPFSFEAGCTANVALTYRGHELLGLHLKLTIWGPDRWRIKGRGEFSILFWDVPVTIDESWGDDVEVPSLTIDLASLVKDDLNNRSNWTFELSGASETFVTFGKVEEPKDPTIMLAHPLATMKYTQRRIPFGLKLDRLSFGSIAGPSFFPVPVISVDGTEVTGATTLLDQFAVPEFLNLSDEDKLTRPSFESLPSGVATGSGGFAVPSAAAVEAAFDYELVLKTTGNTGIRFPGLLDMEATASLAYLVAGEAASRSQMRPIQFKRPGIDPVVNKTASWTAVEPGTLAAAGLGRAADWTLDSAAAVSAMAGPRLQVVEAFEVAG